jgi:hypothetical protein
VGRVFGYLWPSDMTMIEASLNGTFRTILVLLIVWWLLRFFLRMSAQRQVHRPAPGGGAQRTNEVPRAPGEVRVERTAQDKGRAPGHGPVIIDADFEEIK